MSRKGPLEAALMPLHDDLEALFFAHQVALLDRDIDLAVRRFTAFREALEMHAADEEAYVLPLYAQYGGDETDSPSTQFRIEHDKIRRFLAELGGRIAECARSNHVDDRELLAILDRESWFKNLFVHHDIRERRVLYPTLSRSCGDEMQEAVLSKLRLRAITPCG